MAKLSKKAVELTRVFKMGSVELPFPPSETPLDPTDALALYQPNYPQLAQCTIGTPYNEGDKLVYPVEKPPAKTKGAT